MKRKLFIGVAVGILCALSVLAGCAQQSGSASSSASSAAPGSASGSASSAASGSGSEPSSDEVVVLDGQGGVEVILDYHAGTGYEWECSVDYEDVLGIMYQDTRPVSDDKDITGGPLQDVVTLIASSPGTATLTCELKRPWETDVEPAEVQTFVFTVDSELQIDFDEAASNYVNPPAAISFS